MSVRERNAYNRGYDAGYSDGYAKGFTDGKIEDVAKELKELNKLNNARKENNDSL